MRRQCKCSQPNGCTIVQYSMSLRPQSYRNFCYTTKTMWKSSLHEIALEAADLCRPHLLPQRSDFLLTRLLPPPLRLSIGVIPARVLSAIPEQRKRTHPNCLSFFVRSAHWFWFPSNLRWSGGSIASRMFASRSTCAGPSERWKICTERVGADASGLWDHPPSG